MSLSEFFECRLMRKAFAKSEFKGILFSRYTYLFYVFINNYYLKGVPDLDKLNFRLDLSRRNIEQAKEIQFFSGSPIFERKSIKYVKIVSRRKMYLTLNAFETHRIIFSEGEEDGEGQLIAAIQGDLFVHKCIHQIFLISSVAFCFETYVSVRA